MQTIDRLSSSILMERKTTLVLFSFLHGVSVKLHFSLSWTWMVILDVVLVVVVVAAVVVV